LWGWGGGGGGGGAPPPPPPPPPPRYPYLGLTKNPEAATDYLIDFSTTST
jgi:hypothetical protein